MTVSNYPEFKYYLEGYDVRGVTSISLGSVLERKLVNLEEKPSFSILDVGSSDGELALLITEQLRKKLSNLELTAIEPEIAAFEKLIKNTNKLNFINCYNITYQEYLKENPDKEGLFDFMLFSQCFYHFSNEEWEPIIGGSIRMLHDDGYISIVIDSHKCEAYKLLEKVTEGVEDTLEYGYLHSAEDIKRFLIKRYIKFDERSFPVYLCVKDDEQKLDSLARHLAFLYRTFPEKILAHHKEDLKQMLRESTRLENHYIIENRVKIMTISNP